MRITLLLCLCLQFAFPMFGSKTTMNVPHTKSLSMTSFHHSTLTTWSLNDVLDLYPEFSTQEDSIKVYPNPIYRKDMLNITMDGDEKKRLVFYDITGNVVKLLETEKKSISFSIAEFGPGIYMLNVSSLNFKATKKVIVK
ncbi:T9SS type A sorting domain-containing protein [Joostella sp. CR20]|uniref:T9SS type A sorting domain-containing protein n=1 Tax=Joostella sp. CR20 TaxID=2804312 RepID=UPI00313DC977